MKIRSIHVSNYKSIKDSGRIELGERLTVLTGANNVGKTALLERFALFRLVDKPHLSSKEGPSFVPNPHSSTRAECTLTGTELKRLFLAANSSIRVPVPPTAHDDDLPDYVRNKYFSSSDVDVLLSWTGGGLAGPQESSNTALVSCQPNRSDVAIRHGGGAGDGLPGFLANQLDQLVYVFRAERLSVGSSGMQGHLALEPNAANLAGALMQLQGDHVALFQRFTQHVREILPLVRHVSVATSLTHSGMVSIRVWNEDPMVSPSSVGRSLDDCGTGVGQVLAILYVVLTSQHGRVIVIDEPASFLHPSAVRALLRTLKQYPQNQYIISTHTPEVIAAVEADRLIRVYWEDGETKLDCYGGADISAARLSLSDIGARLSDVFGHDAIVWVEGATEAECFPRIARAADAKDDVKIGFVPLISTGELLRKRGRDATLAWRIVDRLSKQSALVPQTLTVSFDREGLTDPEMTELAKRSGDRVRFLPRRCYENYLLQPTALSAVFPDLGSRDVIEKWLARNGGTSPYKAEQVWNGDVLDLEWLKSVDGAKLLTDLFSDLTQNREEYRKTSHSVALTLWLLEHDPNHLAELQTYVSSLTEGMR